MLSRAVPVLLAGPLAGVLLDRLDRQRVMIASDLLRAVVALAFILPFRRTRRAWLYPLSAMLMFASPFFTSGRSAILPSIATKEELHTANTLTQTTQWITLTLGGFFAGIAVKQFGYEWAFVLNSLSFAVLGLVHLAACALPPERRAEQESFTEVDWMRPWREYSEGLRYMRSIPLVLWDRDGARRLGDRRRSGADFVRPFRGDRVQNGLGRHRNHLELCRRGTCAGRRVRPLAGTAAELTDPINARSRSATWFMAHRTSCSARCNSSGRRLLFIALSRAAVAVSSVLNMTQLMLHVDDEFRGRVFATLETLTWGVMMLSMMAAGAASEHLQSAHDRSVGGTAQFDHRDLFGPC